jgi:hypothetical protein
MKTQVLNAEMKIAGGNQGKLELPNFASNHCYVPSKLSLKNLSDESKEEADRCGLRIDCSVQLDNVVVLRSTESFFKFSDTVELKSFKNQVNSNSKIWLNIRNLDRSAHTYSIAVEYMYYEGDRIYENVFNDKFAEILPEVANCGQCTKLYIKSSHPLKNTNIVPTFSKLNLSSEEECSDSEGEDDDFEWLDKLEIGETDEENCYVLDLTDADIQVHARNLNFLELQVNGIDDFDDFKLYVLAFGFRR